MPKSMLPSDTLHESYLEAASNVARQSKVGEDDVGVWSEFALVDGAYFLHVDATSAPP